MKKKTKKTLNRIKKRWRKTTWFEKTLGLFKILYNLCKIVGWLNREIPTVWPIIEETLKNLL